MEFEWDEAKRAINLGKHQFDFVDATKIWRGPVIDPSSMRVEHGELRLVALSIVHGDERVIAVVYTWRGESRRIISVRRARSYERADYQDQFGRGR